MWARVRRAFDSSVCVCMHACSSDETWQGVRQRYFHDDTYHMPVCCFSGEAAPAASEE